MQAYSLMSKQAGLFSSSALFDCLKAFCCRLLPYSCLAQLAATSLAVNSGGVVHCLTAHHCLRHFTVSADEHAGKLNLIDLCRYRPSQCTLCSPCCSLYMGARISRLSGKPGPRAMVRCGPTLAMLQRPTRTQLLMQRPSSGAPPARTFTLPCPSGAKFARTSLNTLQ